MGAWLSPLGWGEPPAGGADGLAGHRVPAQSDREAWRDRGAGCCQPSSELQQEGAGEVEVLWGLGTQFYPVPRSTGG